MINKENFPDSPIGDEPVWLTKQLGDFNYNEVEFSKSLLDDEDEEELKKKRRITELQDIDVEEVSYVDIPATRQKFMVVKGGDKKVDKCEWATVQNQIFGYTEDDLDMLEDNYIEKSSPDDKFPTLTRQFNLNRAILEKRYEEYELESRLV